MGNLMVMDISPEKARNLLKRNRNNRKIRPDRINAIIRQLREGDWGISDSKIMFDLDGNLVNGQHRLIACAISGVTLYNVTVEYGVPRDMIQNIDTGLGRSIGDSLHMKNNCSAIARFMFLREGYERFQISRPTLLKFIQFHIDAVSFASQQFAKIHPRGLGLAAAISVVARAWYTVEDKDRLQSFCQVLLTGLAHNYGEDSAAITLRNYLLTKNREDYDTTRRTEICLQNFLDRKPMTEIGTGRYKMERCFPIPNFFESKPIAKDLPVYSRDKIPETDSSNDDIQLALSLPA